MAQFTAEVFSNEYLAEGATDVHAIVRVACAGAGVAGADGGPAAEIIILDTSGSMYGPKMAAAQYAAQVAIDQIVDGTWFAIVGGNHMAARVFPYPNARAAIVQMSPGARAEAKRAISMVIATGGTAMSTWLGMAAQLFASCPATQRHALLLTDGKNESEHPAMLQQMLTHIVGKFQCDARGVGQNWVVSELRTIASALLGTVELIADPTQMAADFVNVMRTSMSRGVSNAELRIWAPQGAGVLFVRQVSPHVEDLTVRALAITELIRQYPTGSWGDETRDYQIAIRVPPRPVGSEQLAARVQLVVNGEPVTTGLVKAAWSDDPTRTAQISPEVAHYTGQTELAQVIQQGLEAKAVGDEATATIKLGRAVQLAHQTGNHEATVRLRKVVDVHDEDTGTVRLRRDVTKIDEMALDTASTKTTRVRK